MRQELRIAIDPADAKGENPTVTVTVVIPDPAMIGDQPLVWFAWPGGGCPSSEHSAQHGA